MYPNRECQSSNPKVHLGRLSVVGFSDELQVEVNGDAGAEASGVKP